MMYNKQKNSHIPILVMPMYARISSGTNGSILKLMSLSTTARITTDITIAILRIAPSMPKHELNLRSFTALIKPNTVSAITATTTTSIKRFPARDNKNKFATEEEIKNHILNNYMYLFNKDELYNLNKIKRKGDGG